MEIFLSLLYALLAACFNIFRKLAVNKTNTSAVLALFTSGCAILALFWIPFGVAVNLEYFLILAFKGLIIALSWYVSLEILKSADLSIVGATYILSSVLTFLAGLFLFNETTSVLQVVGAIIVVLGVFFINLANKGSKGSVSVVQFLLLLLCALISAGSGVIDKYTTDALEPPQVQFWFLIFVCLFSWVFFAIDCFRKKQSALKKSDFKNLWIILMSLVLFFGDICLFSAYKVPNSKMITITLLGNLRSVFTVLGGIVIFKEKNIWRKIILSLIIIMGAVFISL